MLGCSRLKQVVCLFTALLATPALAWGPPGHRIIAAIAADNLTSRAAVTIDMLWITSSEHAHSVQN